MAEYRDEFGNLIRRADEYGNPISTATDEYGNPIRQTDEYGNPIHPSSGTTGGYGTAPTGGAGYVGGQPQQQHGVTGMLHRSGSSSSSSSEDDGHGGRRKKGMKEKIKEKLPGTGTGTHKEHAAGTTTGHEVPIEHHEKKGVMEKIKEKLPGAHHH